MSSDAWIRHFHDARAGAPTLVCLPHAGGSAPFFFPFSAGLTPVVQVLSVQYPGRQDRRHEPCLQGVPDLVDALVPILMERGDPASLALFGHSMGAVLAFEVAARLEQRYGAVVRRLFVSGRGAPARYRPDAVHALDDEGLIARLAELAGTDPRVLDDPDMRATVLPAIRADYRAIESYRWTGSVVSAPITALTGDADRHAPADEVADWRLHTTGECTVRTFAGGHFFLADQRAAVLDAVRADLSVIGRTVSAEER